jgi:hypothetical protein
VLNTAQLHCELFHCLQYLATVQLCHVVHLRRTITYQRNDGAVRECKFRKSCAVVSGPLGSGVSFGYPR